MLSMLDWLGPQVQVQQQQQQQQQQQSNGIAACPMQSEVEAAARKRSAAAFVAAAAAANATNKRPLEDIHEVAQLNDNFRQQQQQQSSQTFATFVDNSGALVPQSSQLAYLAHFRQSASSESHKKFKYDMSSMMTSSLNFNNSISLNTNTNNNNNITTLPRSQQQQQQQQQQPSVNNFLSVRNFPTDATEKDIEQLLTKVTCNAKTVSSMAICRNKNQAIVEVIDETTAMAIVNYFQQNQAQILNQNVIVEVCDQQELKTLQSQSNKVTVIGAANGNGFASGAVVADDATSSRRSSSSNGAVDNSFTASAPAVAVTTVANTVVASNTTVLRVIIENMIYPVTIDVLYVLFQTYGKVLKIVTFIKNGVFQALIQYADAASSKKAKTLLDGQNIYNNCCTLRVEYSKMAMLKVKYNNEKSRDYTNTSLPPYDLSDAASAAVAANGANLALIPAAAAAAAAVEHSSVNSGFMSATNPFASAIPGTTPNDFLLLANQARLPAAATAQSQPTRSTYPFGATPTTADSSAILAAVAAAAASSNNPFVSSPYAAAIAAANNAFGSLAFSSNHVHLPTNANPMLTTFLKPGQCLGTCLHVSNLNEQMVTPDALFTLFGVYGDVIRVKILYNKKDSALVQMAETQQAQLAIMHMDKLRVFGKCIKITLSRHQSVQMPKEGQPDTGLTKDYAQSPLHRFKKPGSKNYSNIYAPSSTLHLSNIPASVTEENMREHFKINGFNVKAFKFFPKDNKMALIQLTTLEEAVMALIKMHNYQLSESNHLRVSFSKSNI